jgi:hypothetical protein
MSSLKTDNKGNVECPKCSGRGHIEKQTITLVDICDRCSGACYLDWVSVVMMKKREQDLQHKRHSYVLDNINRLRNEIIQQGTSLGFNIRVDIEIKPYEYQTRYLNQIGLNYGGS